MSDIFTCKLCGSDKYELKDVETKNGTMHGLYCAECGKWSKWLGKNELSQYQKLNGLKPGIVTVDEFPPTQPKKNLVMWQYCRDLNVINDVIKEPCDNWDGLTDASQIISITYDDNHGCYVVFWKVER